MPAIGIAENNGTRPKSQ